MAIYRIYDDNGDLICLDKTNGCFISLDTASKIHDVVDRFIIDGYRIILDGNNMILMSKNMQLHLSNYVDLLKNYYFSFLDYDIHNTMSVDGYSSLSDIEKKFKLPKRVLHTIINKATCTSLVFSVFCNILPVNIAMTRRSDSINSGISRSIVDDFNDKNADITDFIEDSSANSGISSYNLENEDNSEIDTIESNEPEPEYSDEEIEKIFEFIEYNHLTLEKFGSLIEIMTSEDGPFGALYASSKEALKAIAADTDELSYQVKFLTIMIREGNTYAEMDKMCAGVVGEAFGGGNCYDDAYAVASTLINRTHAQSYVNKYGHNLYSQFCAPGQYEVEYSGNYKEYLGQIDLEGYHAAIDAFYTRESMHNYLEFRANWVQLSRYETFVTGGNKFIIKMKEGSYVPYPEEEIELENVKELVLTNTNYYD